LLQNYKTSLLVNGRHRERGQRGDTSESGITTEKNIPASNSFNPMIYSSYKKREEERSEKLIVDCLIAFKLNYERLGLSLNLFTCQLKLKKIILMNTSLHPYSAFKISSHCSFLICGITYVANFYLVGIKPALFHLI